MNRTLVDSLLKGGWVVMAEPIFAEVTSGARTRSDFVLLSTKLKARPWIEPPDGLWSLVAESRYRLARQGIQAHQRRCSCRAQSHLMMARRSRLSFALRGELPVSQQCGDLALLFPCRDGIRMQNRHRLGNLHGLRRLAVVHQVARHGDMARHVGHVGREKLLVIFGSLGISELQSFILQQHAQANRDDSK